MILGLNSHRNRPVMMAQEHQALLQQSYNIRIPTHHITPKNCQTTQVQQTSNLVYFSTCNTKDGMGCPHQFFDATGEYNDLNRFFDAASKYNCITAQKHLFPN
ncbi:unnamed protein product [Periconia digitata]|uniref:Uncharacterized protein n=1 Tax=Periconia digitata TaxID=1303443 RepID=A0A9W4XJP0_9PLEO|nr:unnamed protein product [Periconia digitata]